MTDQVVKIGRIRAAVAKAMSVSAAVPQFVLDRDIDPTRLLEVKSALQRPVSLADLLNAAVIRTLNDHPRLNACWRDTEIIEFADVNLGVAIAVPDGIVAPAILRAHNLDLFKLASERTRLQEAARAGSLTFEEMASATFTISNLGTLGISRIQPLVIPPQAAMLGVPARRRSGEMSLCLACDHRVTDGLPAAEFLADLADRIENPDWLESATNTPTSLRQGH